MAKKEEKGLVTPPGVEKSGAKEAVGETPDEPVNAKPRNLADDEVFTPRVSVASRGKISKVLEGIAGEYRRLNPGMDCRWVYDSVTKPELSNVLSRITEGYRMVKPEELKGSDMPLENFLDEKGKIRMADTVLMGIPTGQRKVNAQERQRLADAQLQRVKENFQQTMEEVRAGEHRAAARGAVNMREKDHDISYEQPSKE